MKTRNLFPNILALALITLPLAARAQTWTGGGPDANIDDSTNWGGSSPAFDGSADVTFASGGSVATVNTNVSFDGIAFNAPNNFTINGPGTLTNGVSGIQASGAFTYTIASGLELAANQIWPINSGTTLVISGTIDDGGAGYNLLKSLTGTLTLKGTNTYSGTTTFSGGTLNFSSIGMVGGGGSALGAPTNAANGTINLGGSATVYYTGGTTTSDRILNLTGPVTFRTDTATGPLTLTGGITGSGTLAFRTGQTITETGEINIGGNTLTRTSSGTLVLHNAANSFGFVDIYQGVISVDSIADSGLPSSFGNGTNFAMGQATTFGTLQFTGAGGGECNRPMVISGTTSGKGGGIIENTVTGQTLTMSGTVDTGSGSVAPSFQLIGAGNGVMSGTIQNTVGSLFLTKSGAGIWTLSGTNTYTGTTTVSTGKLAGVVGGSCANSAVTVNNTAGCVLGIAVTDNTKQFSCAGLTFLGANAALDFNFGYSVAPSSSVAPLQINGNVAFTGTPTVTIEAGAIPAGTGTYPLMTWTGNVSGTAPASATLPPHITGTLSVVGKTLQLNVTANKQPLTWTQGTGIWDVNTSTYWKDSAGTTGQKYLETTLPGDSVIFDDTPSGPGPFTVSAGAAIVTPAGVSVNSIKNYTIQNVIAGSTALTKSGNGTLTLSGANTYVSNTTINLPAGAVAGVLKSKDTLGGVSAPALAVK